MNETTKKKSTRLDYPTDEAGNPWLSFAFNAYYKADTGVSEAISDEEKKGKKLACKKGCANCCKSHTTIPIFPLELLGLYWFVSHKMDSKIQQQIKTQLQHHQKGNSCPFLLDGECTVHPMRPLACRHFNVFDKVCEEGEDAYYSRREDVMTPLSIYQNEALAEMLPFHGLTTEAQKNEAMKEAYIEKQAKVLQDIDWSDLASRI